MKCKGREGGRGKVGCVWGKREGGKVEGLRVRQLYASL